MASGNPWALISLMQPSSSTPVSGSMSSRGEHKSLRTRFLGHIPPSQLGRYLLIGGWNTLFGYSCYAALVALVGTRHRHGYVLATLLSSLINITVSFLGYKWLVFRTKGNYLKEWTRAVAVYSGGIALGTLILPLVVETLRRFPGLDRGAPYVGGAVITVLGTLYNFLGHKNFSFRSQTDAKPAASGPDPIASH